MIPSTVNRQIRAGQFFIAAFAALAGTAALHGQAFEVASVKLNRLPANQFVFRFSAAPTQLQVQGNRFERSRTCLNWLIMDAYNLRDFQISGLPRWAEGSDCDTFQVIAKSEKTPSPAELQQMLQLLLADRFQLKLHKERREIPVYALAIEKRGLKMRKLRDDEVPPTYATRPSATGPSIGPFTGLVGLIGRSVDRPVIDETGLTGAFESSPLDWGLFARELKGTGGENAGGLSIFGSLSRELGLRLEPRKDLAEVLVIEHAERPSEN